jgi:uncharacterized membrane protein YukC
MNNRVMRIVMVGLIILGCLRGALAADLVTVLSNSMVKAGSTTVTSVDSFQSNVSAASEEVEAEEEDAEIAVEETDDEEDFAEDDVESDSAEEADEDEESAEAAE